MDSSAMARSSNRLIHHKHDALRFPTNPHAFDFGLSSKQLLRKSEPVHRYPLDWWLEEFILCRGQMLEFAFPVQLSRALMPVSLDFLSCCPFVSPGS